MVRPHSGSGDLMMAVMNVGGGAPPMRPRLSAAHHAQQLQTPAPPHHIVSASQVDMTDHLRYVHLHMN